jgi:hypothetical protein
MSLHLDGYYTFEVSTLHQVPPTLAALAYESLELISAALVCCLTPADMWAGEFNGSSEDFRDEYQTLCAAGGAANLAALVDTVCDEEFHFFSSEPSELAEQLALAHEMFEARPPWLRPSRVDHPIAAAQRLEATVQQYVQTHDRHPWADYVKHVCSTLRACFANDRSFARSQERKRQTQRDRRETEVPLYQALWVDSGAACERHHANGLYQSMSEIGEVCVERYDLSALATTDLREILEHTAIGLGLLLRAEAVDADVRSHSP